MPQYQHCTQLQAISPREQRPSIVSSLADSETTTTGEKWVSLLKSHYRLFYETQVLKRFHIFLSLMLILFFPNSFGSLIIQILKIHILIHGT